MGHDLLEYSALKDYIQPFIASDVGLSALSELAPCDSWDEARRRLAVLSEMMGMMESSRPPELAAISDIRPLLSIREGSVLEGQDLVRVADVLVSMARLKKDLQSRDGLLAGEASPMEPLEHVSSQINALLLPTGEISDDAYPLLRDLRNRYRAIRSSILEKLEQVLERLKTKSVLMEELITKRNDRYVIPVRHDYHVHMKGITHDYSRTNRTVYVEPMTVVDENNTLNQIKSQILEEEHKVLKDLTSLVHRHTGEIRRNLLVYGRLDLLAACSRWAIRSGAAIPRIEGEEMNLMGARHPLLLERLGTAATVPLDIRIPRGRDCLLITGPNAGGKTVALKTLGLLILMARSGLAIPARADSTIAPVGSVWVEMDTNQDITHDLSSFTAHALSLKSIYEHARPGDLVLLDEPGTGTDHEQGGALAVSCIHALRNKGTTVVVTSHSDLVKLYGITSEGVENAATAFDDSGLKPLYTLQYGVVGQSRAFEILEAIEFPHDLIVEARGIVNREVNSTLARAIEDISKASSMRLEAARELAEARRLKENAAAELQDHKKERMESALRYRRLLDQLEVLSRRQVSPEKVRAVREAPETAEVVKILADAEPARSLNIEKGCTVRLRGSEQEGEVAETGQGFAEVVFGTKRLRVGLDQVFVVAPPEPKGAKRETVSRMKTPPPVLPIKVVGMRVDEALPLVERAVDRAMLTGQDRLEIIHGAGTGRLKKAIREYLKGLPCVKAMTDAPMAEGGGNKTIVTLGVG
ncbi:MAG: Smr/MutS family protein [Desulfobacterota bacterium]|jgi:DNA mismatch repair protein MutS2|nr:Smr/MutS family protein [Thermodesulfobacteriota bacterium]